MAKLSSHQDFVHVKNIDQVVLSGDEQDQGMSIQRRYAAAWYILAGILL